MVKTKILNDIKAALKKCGFEYDDNFQVELPANAEFGDYSSNVALLNAKKNKITPRELATKLSEELKKSDSYPEVTIAGPGFLNFRLAPAVLQKALTGIHAAGEQYGKTTNGKGKKVNIEFISATPTGPLNVVNARAAAFGDTLYRLMRYTGYDAVREFYINDAGNQVDILAESLELRYRELHGEILKEFPMEAYHGEYVKELAQRLNAIEGQKLLMMAEKDRLKRMRQFALEEIHNMQVESLEKFGVTFDNWVSEKVLRNQGIVQEVLSYLAEAGCTYEKEDAVWFSSSDFGDEKDRVLMKADGTFTYIVPDIGYHLTKFQRGFDLIIDVLGPDHHGYIPRLKGALSALGYDAGKMEFILLQQVNLFDEGEKVKMSKREGKMVTMDELITEVGKDAARYFFVDRRSSAHLNFDLELAKKQSAENPVYYVQYAYARICSVLKKAKKERKIKIEKLKDATLVNLVSDEELSMVKKLIEFPGMLINAADAKEPHRLTQFSYELASMFHKYYQNVPILNAEENEIGPDVIEARLYLITVVKDILGILFNLLGIEAPEKM